MVIDIGIAVNGLIVDEVAFDQPGAWFMKCRNGHKGIFATTEMLETDKFTCKECETDAAAYARLQERIKLADELDAAGRTNDPDYEALIEAERSQP
jgi:hypothetical protein